MWFLWAILSACHREPPTSYGSAPTGDDDDNGDDDDDDDTGGVAIRVATWNIQYLGNPGSTEFEAVRAVLDRIDADIVSLNEVSEGEESDLEDLAADLGYDTVVTPTTNPFGAEHNAILTRLPVIETDVLKSDELSDDSGANDITRWFVSVEVEVEGQQLAVVGQHWKSGFELIDEFRRVLESIRSVQAAESRGPDAFIVLGDMNAELDDPAPSVPVWEYVPSGEPFDFSLGEDIAAMLDSGIDNDVFAPLFDAGLEVVDALQLDGRDGTREESGRRIDHIFVSSEVEVKASEVYDARDESFGGVPKAGEAPDRDATLDASDHFPVLVDIEI